MDKLYPDWRFLYQGFFDNIYNAPKSIKVPFKKKLKSQKIPHEENSCKAKLRETDIYFTPQLKTSPKISVYITSYNQKKYLVESIESILAQTLRPHQIIVVDDFSNDGSQELIAEYAQKYLNLIFPIYHTKNYGIVQTRIDALNAVTGDFVTYIDGDDRFLPEKLAHEVDVLAEKTDAQIVYSNNYYIGPEGQRTGIWADEEDLPQGYVFKEIFGRKFPKSNLFRMELVNYQALKSVGFHDPAITSYENFDMLIRLTKHYPVAFCDESLSEIRLHDKGLSEFKANQHLASLEFIYHKNRSLLADLSESDLKVVKEGFNDFVNKISLSAVNRIVEDREIKNQDSGKISYEVVDTRSKHIPPTKINELGANLIFLISQSRAGSTLFQKLLAGHPEIHSMTEPWIMLHPIYALKEDGINAEYHSLLARHGLEDFVGQVPEGIELYRIALRKMGCTLYNRVLELSGKQFFLDKTPRYYHIIPELYSIFPEAKFIFLLRNPIEVLSSVIETNRVDDLEIPSLIDLIKGPGCLLDGIKMLKEKAIVVDYESFIQSPESVIRRVCNRIGILFYRPLLNRGQCPKPEGGIGDANGVNQNSNQATDNIDKWLLNFSSLELIALADEYLKTLGPEIVSNMGYNFEVLRQKLELRRQLYYTAQRNLEKVIILNREGERHFANGDVEAALAKFQTALKFEPNHAETHSNLGVTYYKKGDKKNAFAHYQKAIQLDPMNIIYLKNIAYFHFAAIGNIEEASRICVNILKVAPQDIDTLKILGKICVGIKKFEDAAVFYKRILKIDPNNPEAVFHLQQLNYAPKLRQRQYALR